MPRFRVLPRPGRAGLLLVALLALASPHAAFMQADPTPESSPLFVLLGAVPAAGTGQDGVQYVDYAALTESVNADGNDDPRALYNITAGPRFLQYLIGADFAPVTGFAWAQVDQSITYGVPPTDVTVVRGAFDADAIAEAYARRAYTAAEDDVLPDGGSYTLYCPPDGCDSGAETDLLNRDLNDPFGGELGRTQPVMVVSAATSEAHLVASSTSDRQLVALRDAASGDADSLLGEPHVLAIASAALDLGVVRQMTIVTHNAAFGTDGGRDYLALADIITPEAAESAAAAEDGWPTLQLGAALLPFETAEAAEQAAEAILDRVETIDSYTLAAPWADAFDERGLALTTDVYADAATGLHVLRVRLAGPIIRPETGLPTVAASYRLLYQALIQRDARWLMPE